MSKTKDTLGRFKPSLSKLVKWSEAKAYEDITYHKGGGIARIAFNRPEKRNAFRPLTIDEMAEALLDAWQDESMGVVMLTGNGPSRKDGKHAFCSGGDQSVRGHAGYVGGDGRARLNVYSCWCCQLPAVQ